MLKKRVSRESKATHPCEILSTSNLVSTGHREGGVKLVLISGNWLYVCREKG